MVRSYNSRQVEPLGGSWLCSYSNSIRGLLFCQLTQTLTTFDFCHNNQTTVIPLLLKNRKAHFRYLLRGGVTDGSNMLIDFILNKGLALWLGLGHLWGGGGRDSFKRSRAEKSAVGGTSPMGTQVPLPSYTCNRT